MRESSSWAAWAQQLVSFIQQSMREWKKGETNEDSENELRQIKLQQLMMDVGSEGMVY